MPSWVAKSWQMSLRRDVPGQLLVVIGRAVAAGTSAAAARVLDARMRAQQQKNPMLIFCTPQQHAEFIQGGHVRLDGHRDHAVDRGQEQRQKRARINAMR